MGEVLWPIVLQRVEKRDLGAGLGIRGLDLGGFPKTAMRALKRQVPDRGETTLTARNNMVDVKNRCLTYLPQAAIATLIGISLAHLRTKRLAN